MIPITLSTLSIGQETGNVPNVRVLLRATVEEISGSRMTLLGFESEDQDGKTRSDSLVITPDVAEGLAEALRTVLDRRGPV
jgi:hypothetical protein